MKKVSLRFVTSVVLGALLAGICFLTVRESYTKPATPVACPEIGQVVMHQNWFSRFLGDYVRSTQLGSDPWCNHYRGWWAAGWPLALSSDFFPGHQSNPNLDTAAVCIVIIGDFLFWWLVAFAILSGAAKLQKHGPTISN